MERIVLPWASIGHLLEQAAAAYGTKPLLICNRRQMTFSEVNARVNRVANAMRATLRVHKGDRVSVMLPTGFDLPILWLATAKLGANIVLTNTNVQQDDLAYLLSDAGTSQIILDAAYLPTLQQIGESLRDLNEIIVAGEVVEGYTSFEAIISTEGDHFMTGDVADIDLATIQYTAGATGNPKGCMTSHRYWLVLGHVLARAYGIGPRDVLLTAQPFYQLDPQWMLMLSLVSGAPLVMLPDASPEKFWQAVREHNVTFLYLPATLQDRLLSERENPLLEQGHQLRLVVATGIDAQYHAAYERRWNVPWREVFRMAEAGVAMLVPPDDTASVRSGAMGVPIVTKEARVVDASGADVAEGATGELLLRGEPMMFGYWNRAEETAQALRDGWLHTGDLVYRDARGYYHWAGRVEGFEV